MRVSTVVGVVLVAAALQGCSSSDDDVSRPTTTSSTALRLGPTTTTTTVVPRVPDAAAVPVEPRRHHVRLGERRPRSPRITRQATRAHLEQALASRRPGYTYPPAELDQLTTRAMQIRVARQRFDRMRAAALDTPRAAATRARIEALMADFAAKAGVPVDDVPAILALPPPPLAGADAKP